MTNLKKILSEKLNHLKKEDISFLDGINKDFTDYNSNSYIFLVGSALDNKDYNDLDLVVNNISSRERILKIGEKYKTSPLHVLVSEIGLGRKSCPIYFSFKEKISGNFNIKYE